MSIYPEESMIASTAFVIVLTLIIIMLWGKRKDQTPTVANNAEGESSSRSDTLNSTPKWEFDVFLSFAGEDTRLKFMSHLYEAFKTGGINTFRDDVVLKRGGDIKKGLSQAIEDSLCEVVIISENYAYSTWCLDELQKILESQKTLNRRVFPIFYDVNPADVRKQRNSFGKALAEHERKFRKNATKVQNWRDALFEVSNLCGWDTRGKDEADVIKDIIREVSTYLCSQLPSFYNNLVGLDSRVRDMMKILEIGSDDAYFLGIWGMGGVGKTTLAGVVFEKLSHNFEVCCFLKNVRETLLHREGLVSLQSKLLSNLTTKKISNDYEGMKMIRNLLCKKKVLLVLDDVDKPSQLKYLVESPDWFGKGSRIIITTRDSQLLTSSRVDKQRIYEMKTMKYNESLQLFSKTAFNKDRPEPNYLKLSESVVEYAGGLPLALEVLGQHFCDRSEAEWRDALDRLKQGRLKQTPDDSDILQVLKISYDGLKNEEDKRIFLDIACFFKGWQRKKVTQIMESCDLHATIGIDVLIQKTLLVETADCRLDMHDLVEDLGKYIIRLESPNNVGKRSRLWEFEHIKEVLENNKGHEAIEAIVMQNYYGEQRIQVHPEAFSKMSNIRLLIFGDRWGDWLILPRKFKHFRASKLKVVRWTSFHLRALPLPLDELVYIKMYDSKIEQLWNGNPLMDKLKFINLSRCHNFSKTPDFSRIPALEHLHLYGCASLVEVHSSLGKLKKLVEVCLIWCENLETLPRKLETNSLIKLDLHLCKKVTVLPEFGEDMKELSYLDVSCTAVNLGEVLKTCITHQISWLNVTSLTGLYLHMCGLNDGLIPDDFGSLPSLIVLDLSDNCFVNLPIDCFSRLSRLTYLSLKSCSLLKSLPRLPPRLVRLDAGGCESLEALLDRQSWNLVASLVHEYRGRTKYVISYDDDDDDYDYHYYRQWAPKQSKEHVPLRDFCAIIPNCEIPLWFPNKMYFHEDKRGEKKHGIIVNIPPHLHDSEWFGIVVCFGMSDYGNFNIRWGSKGAEDDDYIWIEWAHVVWLSEDDMCIMVLELNEETCWKHLTPNNNTLHIKLSIVDSWPYDIEGECAWRVICKEEIQKWCSDNHFTQPQLPSPPHDDGEINLPWRVLGRSIIKVK